MTALWHISCRFGIFICGNEAKWDTVVGHAWVEKHSFRIIIFCWQALQFGFVHARGRSFYDMQQLKQRTQQKMLAPLATARAIFDAATVLVAYYWWIHAMKRKPTLEAALFQLRLVIVKELKLTIPNHACPATVANLAKNIWTAKVMSKSCRICNCDIIFFAGLMDLFAKSGIKVVKFAVNFYVSHLNFTNSRWVPRHKINHASLLISMEAWLIFWRGTHLVTQSSTFTKHWSTLSDQHSWSTVQLAHNSKLEQKGWDWQWLA